MPHRDATWRERRLSPTDLPLFLAGARAQKSPRIHDRRQDLTAQGAT